MVLEGLVNPAKATGKPWEMFFVGALYSLIAVGLSYWVFRAYVSLVMVTFTTIAAIPFLHAAVMSQEQLGQWLKSLALLKEHAKMVSIFLFLFLGFVTVFFSLFVLLPEAAVGEIFRAQIDSIASINGTATGSFFSLWSYFSAILLSNLRVLFFCLLFSLFYGVGSIFILSWNASVMGAAIGDAIRDGLLKGQATGLQVISTSLFGYFVHGLPEMVAFFIASLAGGILSFALLREGFKSEGFYKSSQDAFHLVGFALILLFLAALIEVFVSPNIL